MFLDFFNEALKFFRQILSSPELKLEQLLHTLALTPQNLLSTNLILVPIQNFRFSLFPIEYMAQQDLRTHFLVLNLVDQPVLNILYAFVYASLELTLRQEIWAVLQVRL